MKAREKKLNKDMTFVEILDKYPYLSRVFEQYKLHCMFCPMARSETIEEGAKLHNMPIAQLMKELLREIEKYEKNNLS